MSSLVGGPPGALGPWAPLNLALTEMVWWRCSSSSDGRHILETLDSDQLTELDPDDDTSESDEDNVLYSEDDSDSDCTEGADIAKILEISINVFSQGHIQCTVYILTIYSRSYGGPW